MELENNDKSPTSPGGYNVIPNDIWYHIADYIPPECVKTFALICHQTRDIVNTRKFWDQMYKKYCLKSFGPTKRARIPLPSHLMPYELELCDKGTLRARVVASLFFTYEPFIERAKRGYELDTLIGCRYEASWHTVVDDKWKMVCKYRQKCMNVINREMDEILSKEFTKTNNFKTLDGDSDEELSDEYSEGDELWVAVEGRNSPLRIYFGEPRAHINEGVSLLVVHTRHTLPSHNKLLYGNGDVKAKLLAIRQNFTSDMRRLNLELDFGHICPYEKFNKTVKYNRVKSCKVYPWWHPEYQKHMLY